MRKKKKTAHLIIWCTEGGVLKHVVGEVARGSLDSRGSRAQKSFGAVHQPHDRALAVGIAFAWLRRGNGTQVAPDSSTALWARSWRGSLHTKASGQSAPAPTWGSATKCEGPIRLLDVQ